MNDDTLPGEHDRAGRAYTRCDHCSAVLPLTVVDLGQAGGMVRCGGCGRTLNALANLYPGFPDPDARRISPSGMPPMLQPHVKQAQILDSSETEEFSDRAEPERGPVLRLNLEPEPSAAWMRILWPVLGIFLAAALVLQLAGPEQWRLDPEVLGITDAAPVAAADAVQLVSRDMHQHPSLDDAFIINAVLVNRSASRVPWPNIELKLFDASQQTVARKRLGPGDYLSPDADRDAGFAPDLRLPIVLEVAAGSSQPSGFSMSFYY